MISPVTEATAREILENAGLLAQHVLFDGCLRRIPTSDKPSSKNGAYIAHGDPPITVWWMNWQSGESGTWTEKEQRSFTPEEQAVLEARKEQNRKRSEAERSQREAEAAKRAQQIFQAALPCCDHPYLHRKGVVAVPGLRQHKTGALIVPLYDHKESLVSLQFIKPDGSKNFLIGGKVKGSFFLIGPKKADAPLLIAEGLATAMSLHECTKLPVLVAFYADNLLPVATTARHYFPGREVILCADNDASEDRKNTGISKATEAALAIDGLSAVPESENGQKCDWNDVHIALGEKAVADLIRQAAPASHLPQENESIPSSTLRCFTLNEFLSLEIPPPQMLLEPFITTKSTVMIHAQRGVGKTHVSMGISYAVATGGSIFGKWHAPKPAKVLFLDGEMPVSMLQERFHALAAFQGSKQPSAKNLRIIPHDMQNALMPNLATPEGQSAITPFLQDTDLLIIDSLPTLAPLQRSNDEESWLTVKNWLLHLRQSNIAVLLIHHQEKGEDQREISAWEDILDTIIRLDRPNDYCATQGAHFQVHFTRTRGFYGTNAQPFEARLTLNAQGGVHWIVNNIRKEWKETATDLFLNEKMSVRDIAKEVGVSSSTVHRFKKEVLANVSPKKTKNKSL